jgi:transcriptional regulator GlxA family with amidase domain
VKRSSESDRTQRILLLAAEGSQILDVVGPIQIFTRAKELLLQRNPVSSPIYSPLVVTCSRRRSIVTNCGLRLSAHKTFREIRGDVDTLLVAGGTAIESDRPGVELVRWIRNMAGRTRRIGSVCTGAMLLARAGLLDGRRATTHWKWCERLKARYPHIGVDPNPIFIRDGNVYTSAGVTAGMDLSLALIEEDHDSRLALEVARDLVLYLRRPGGQSQFSVALSMQSTDVQPLRELEAWVLDNLDKTLTVEVLAEHVGMSPRNFARTFASEMNVTPARFVERLRIEAARRRLEESRNSLDRIAAECGFGSVNSMRSVFQRSLRIAPGQYRQRFHSMAAETLRGRGGA